ncbi:MAG: YbaK/EbsC family protein [Clostridia bacterium]
MDEKVYAVLEKLNISYESIKHPALFGQRDCEKYNINMNGTDCKNLFLKDSKIEEYYLVSLPLTKRLDLKLLKERLNTNRLEFAKEDVLFEKLGVKRGSVSLLNIIEVEKTAVKFVIDSELLKSAKVCFHPNENTSTVIFKTKDIDKILDFYNVCYEYVEL